MNRDLITGIVYTQFDDVMGTNPNNCVPTNLPERLRMLAGIKSVSILTGEGEFIPKSLVVVPFPSVSLKGIIKFIKWEDSSRRGGYARSSITILFNEADDVIFYKYMNNLEEECQKYATRLIALEKKQDKKAKFIEELSSICEQLLLTLEKYRDDELNGLSSITTSKIETKKEEISNYVFKIIVCGDAEVGKSSIVLRFTDNAFKRRYLPTLGTNISEKILEIRDVTVQLILWDIAGQKKFQRMRKHFYGGSNGVILVFDLTRSNTFKTLSSTYQDIKNSLTNGEDIAGFIIGNKNDLENRQIKREDAEKLSKKLNFEYIETSALTGENVEESFLKLAETMYMIAKNQFIK